MEVVEEFPEVVQCGRVQFVVRPFLDLAAVHQSGVAQVLHVMGEGGL